jgi:CheY-like chemotaxis protein
MEHSLTVTAPDGPVYLDADITRLAQMVANLLNNAAKYTRPGGQITRSAAQDGNELVIHVSDNGIGISPAMLPRIFDMFTQADRSLERSEGGAGPRAHTREASRGAARPNLAAHSGGIGTRSDLEARLPAFADQHAAPEGMTSDVNQELEGFPKLRVLVVDDNADAAETLAMLLEHIGCEVRTAADGVEAVEMASSYNPDVAILDIGLPRLNGYEAARRIRTKHGTGMYLMALTGWGQEDDRRKSEEAGFDTHLTKPVSLELLKKVLKEVQGGDSRAAGSS